MRMTVTTEKAASQAHHRYRAPTMIARLRPFEQIDTAQNRARIMRSPSSTSAISSARSCSGGMISASPGSRHAHRSGRRPQVGPIHP